MLYNRNMEEEIWDSGGVTGVPAMAPTQADKGRTAKGSDSSKLRV